MMDSTYWQKQTDSPLFAAIEWNRPERRDQSGRLLILGGNLHNLTAPAQAYELVKQTGIGTVKVALPDKTKRLIGATLPDAAFLPSTPSGEFAQAGKDELLGYANWADTLLLPGDNGRNSQTAILFEEMIRSYSGTIILTRDGFDIVQQSSQLLAERPHTILVMSFAQLQKFVQQIGSEIALTFSMDLVKLVNFLHNLTHQLAVAIVVMHQGQLVTAYQGSVSTTKFIKSDQAEPPHWRLQCASLAACYQTWNPAKLFEALTHSAFLCKEHLKQSD